MKKIIFSATFISFIFLTGCENTPHKLYCENKDGVEQPIADFKKEFVIPPTETSLFCTIK